MDFPRIKRLPPYVLAEVTELKHRARVAGEDIIDLGMGNPDGATPPHIVQKLVEAAAKTQNHRYSLSRGLPKLRLAMANWYRRRFGVELDPDTEVVATIGAKEGLTHMALALVGPGDIVICPSPAYAIHPYSAIIAGADIRTPPMLPTEDLLGHIEETFRQCWPKPKLLTLSFPNNPTTAVVDRRFFERVVDFAHENKLLVIHDFAYADLTFDGYEPPSFLQVNGAKDVGVEFFTLSKSYNMAGWRVGFAVGNREMVGALGRLKSYIDYGIFAPVQIAAIHALNGPQDCVDDIRRRYQRRRDVLCDGLNRAGWPLERPRATMFVWARIPEPFRELGSVEFSKFLLREAKVAVSPGAGFGEYGDEFVRFSLIENEHRTRQAVRGIRKALSRGEVPGAVRARAG
ncbi:MAG: alanine-synthesizing transaminase [Candidatus Binatota bacterium]|jgi:alanine-synthesizing transaminase|nr:alanine-synthesizing transaminase [Candidatus Binatota bacterium]